MEKNKFGNASPSSPEGVELNLGGIKLSRDSLAAVSIGRMVKRFSDIASALGFSGQVNEILDSLGLGQVNAGRNIWQVPRPTGSGSQFKNLSGIDLPENRRPGVQIPVLTPSQAAKGSAAQGIFGEGTREVFPAHPGSDGSGVRVTAPDGTTSSIGIEYTPGYGFTAVFSSVDSAGTRTHERLFVSENGNGSAVTITTTVARAAMIVVYVSRSILARKRL